jgi:hypothetical protein
MLLHAVTWNFDGLAWASGNMQVELFGRKNAWFMTLYDQMLPKLMDQAITPHGGTVVKLQLVSDSEPREVMGVLLQERVRTSLQTKGLPAWG